MKMKKGKRIFLYLFKIFRDDYQKHEPFAYVWIRSHHISVVLLIHPGRLLEFQQRHHSLNSILLSQTLKMPLAIECHSPHPPPWEKTQRGNQSKGGEAWNSITALKVRCLCTESSGALLALHGMSHASLVWLLDRRDCWPCWHGLIIPSTGGLRQKHHKFKPSLIKLARAGCKMKVIRGAVFQLHNRALD